MHKVFEKIEEAESYCWAVGLPICSIRSHRKFTQEELEGMTVEKHNAYWSGVLVASGPEIWTVPYVSEIGFSPGKMQPDEDQSK